MTTSYLQHYGLRPAFPTERHQAATEAVVDHFAVAPRVQAVLLANSCARGLAAPESCVDITILVDPADLPAFHAEWPAVEAFLAEDPACRALAEAVPWSGIDLDVTAGEFEPGDHGWTTGADMYEVEIGNTLAWTHPLLLRGRRFEELRDRYLPYYDEDLRAKRLRSVIHFATNNLDHIVPFARRGLFFQAFKRLYHALEEYLQALFIARRVYPIAYDKWAREQLVDILGEPAIYKELTRTLTMPAFTVPLFEEHSRRLRALLDALAASET
ncbi:MAG: hypothetical protein ACYC4R_04985 [Anaerolineae bacterium]